MAGDANTIECTEWPSTRLAGVLNRFKPTNYFLTNAIFTDIQRMMEDVIRWELVYSDNKMAPHCEPCDEAPLLSSGTYGSISAEPSYVKAKTLVDACKPPSRLTGGDPWMRRPKAERVARKIIEDTRMLENAVQLRIEYMASKVIQDAQYTISVWDQIEQTKVDKGHIDFKRLPHLGEGCLDWANKDSCTVLADMRRCAREVACETNAVIDTLLMGWRAHDAFMQNREILEALKCNQNQNPRLFDIDLNFTPKNTFNSTTFEGRVGPFDIWCSSDFYDCNGEKEFFIDPDAVIGLSVNQDNDLGMGATQLFGAICIHDEFEPMDRHLETWLTKDPSKRYEKIESAPMPILKNANGTFRKKINLPDTGGGENVKKIPQGVTRERL
jgi:hypothetical protein